MQSVHEVNTLTDVLGYILYNRESHDVNTLTDVLVHGLYLRFDGESVHEGVAGRDARVSRQHAECGRLSGAVYPQQTEALRLSHH